MPTAYNSCVGCCEGNVSCESREVTLRHFRVCDSVWWIPTGGWDRNCGTHRPYANTFFNHASRRWSCRCLQHRSSPQLKPTQFVCSGHGYGLLCSELGCAWLGLWSYSYWCLCAEVNIQAKSSEWCRKKVDPSISSTLDIKISALSYVKPAEKVSSHCTYRIASFRHDNWKYKREGNVRADGDNCSHRTTMLGLRVVT